mmetsp:Transcript_20726/g.43746  ORF Transcript_20726/g.43746 Transcript_20726/m.43746 type:complete len:96 (+) Transcript_20726:153-440(+)
MDTETRSHTDARARARSRASSLALSFNLPPSLLSNSSSLFLSISLKAHLAATLYAALALNACTAPLLCLGRDKLNVRGLTGYGYLTSIPLCFGLM